MAADGPSAGLTPREAAQLEHLSDPAVRDLAWLLFSPNLLRAQPPAGVLAEPFESAAEARATLDWLRAEDAQPDALHRHIAAAQVTRLGRYAECLLAWYLRHGPAARLIAANIALRRSGVTIGECDFLVETQTGRRLHWELAVKCYLHAGDGRAQLADYVGPNLQDRFDVKQRRLLDHQLPLSARAEFASLGHGGPWDAQMFVKGWLFYRDGGTPAEPSGIDPAHARGWWTTRADWPGFAATSAALDGARAWAVLPRLQWLSRRRRSGDEAAAGLFDIPTLSAQLALHSGPTMVAAFASDDDAGGWRETSRGFVVPDAWPAQALEFARG
ncbi:DUF1853 family protein [Paraburkholderia solisilvae]|uniref:DUF1853 domain-containing protein n=1 Tax=Paraburkholderia solisilvae TaxID=624376 RepID=A0A6J5F2N7_9BURK|nr:DUF1853 family protein [Paraburkholderia solisilvae]CAB3771927.1 hypothetical protein LMG29739_06155 [Paraburkholderia solisilvae]